MTSDQPTASADATCVRAESGRKRQFFEEERARPPTPTVHIRCFGGFVLTLDGSEADLASLRPKARAVLRMLALHAGRWVHRDRLIEAFWPGVAGAAAVHNVQVTVSSLRTFLEPGLPRGASRVVVRQGASYRLRLTRGGSCDVARFERAVRDGRLAREHGRRCEATSALRTARDMYTGTLLPEDGAAEWLVPERDRLAQEAAWAADVLAELCLERGQPEAAAESAERSLEIDVFRDSAWRTLIDAYERSGQGAAAVRARRRYAEVLASLGLDPTGQDRQMS